MKAEQCELRSNVDELTELGAAEKTSDWRRVVQIGEGLLNAGYANFEIHASLVHAYHELNDRERSDFHLAAVTGFVRSIYATGDGRTPQTAYEVFSSRAQMMLLASLHLQSVNTRSTDRREQADQIIVGIPARDEAGASRVVYVRYNKSLPDKSGPRRGLDTPKPPGSPIAAYRIGGGVSAPKAVRMVDPEYTQEARDRKFQGSVARGRSPAIP